MERKVRNIVVVWNSALERVRHALLKKNVSRRSQVNLKQGLVTLEEVRELLGGRMASFKPWLEEVERRIMVLESILRRTRKCAE